jgi:hypothetical protein
MVVSKGVRQHLEARSSIARDDRRWRETVAQGGGGARPA